MTLLLGLLMFMAITWLIRAWLVQIEPVTVGVELLFGGRFFSPRRKKKMRVLPEGLHWRTLPWPISFVDLISLERDKDTFTVETYTQYGESRTSKFGETAKVIWRVTILFRPYPNEWLLRRYYELSSVAVRGESDRDPGLAIVDEMIRAVMGELVGNTSIATIIDLREQLRLALNVFARGSQKDWEGTDAEVPLPPPPPTKREDEPIPLYKWIPEPGYLKKLGCSRYFKLHGEAREKLLPQLREMLQEIEEEDKKEVSASEETFYKEVEELRISDVEEKTGCQILSIVISEPRFSEETQRAIESRLRALREAEAAQAQWDRKRDLAKEAAGLPVSEGGQPIPLEQAFKEASVTLGESTRNIIDLTGGGSSLVVVQPQTGPKKERR